MIKNYYKPTPKKWRKEWKEAKLKTNESNSNS